MSVVTRTKADVRALAGYESVKGEAGATCEAGEILYLDGTNGWKPANGGAAATALARGVLVSPQDVVDGDKDLSIVTRGRITGFSGMTPGATYFVSDTAGELDTATGTKTKRVGWAVTATILMVDLSVNADPA